MKFTIFTPTFNRENTLPRLYQSLLSQSYNDFEWLIVDDGSSDNTQELIQSFINENKINIIYFKQENGGKHRAINKGLELARGEFFFIVDSDDYLPNKSLQIISEKAKNLSNDIIGVAGRKQYPNSIIIGDKYSKDEFVSDHIEKTYIKNLKGDLAEVIKTNVLRKFKFPDFQGEKFCAEGLIWNRLATSGYKILFFNIPIYNGEYLEGGLSANSIKNRRKSATYTMQLYSELLKDGRIGTFIKIRTYTNFWRFSFFSHLSFFDKWMKIDKSILGLFCYPLGFLMKIKDNRNNNVEIYQK